MVPRMQAAFPCCIATLRRCFRNIITFVSWHTACIQWPKSLKNSIALSPNAPKFSIAIGWKIYVESRRILLSFYYFRFSRHDTKTRDRCVKITYCQSVWTSDVTYKTATILSRTPLGYSLPQLLVHKFQKHFAPTWICIEKSEAPRGWLPPPRSQFLDKIGTKFQRLPPCFRGARNPTVLLGILSDVTGSQKSKMEASNLEIRISRLVDMIATKFQWLLPCFWGQGIQRYNWEYCLTLPEVRNPRWRPPIWKYVYLDL